jgi:hypothetical protein
VVAEVAAHRKSKTKSITRILKSNEVVSLTATEAATARQSGATNCW